VFRERSLWLAKTNDGSPNQGEQLNKQASSIKTAKNTRAMSKACDDESALTKRKMAQIAADADAVWRSNQA